MGQAFNMTRYGTQKNGTQTHKTQTHKTQTHKTQKIKGLALYPRQPPRSTILATIPVILAILLGSCRADSLGGSPDGSPDQTQTQAQTDAAMASQHQGDQPQGSPALDPAPRLPVTGQMVTYTRLGDQDIQGYFAQPQDQDIVGGLVVIHEWWGLNDNIKRMTDRLAGEGYGVLAVDLYGGQQADTPEVAKTLVAAVTADPDRARQNLQGAYDYVAQQPGTDLIGSLGWCFGGGWSLQMALGLPQDLDGAVIYYGRLETDKTILESLQVPILGLFGGLDGSPDPDTVRRFEQTLQELDKPIEVHVYADADHAFANPSGTRYNAEAAEDAWQKTLVFLQQTLQSAN